MKNKWKTDTPQSDGKYCVTLMGKDMSRKVATSTYKDGKWLNPNVIAWRPIEVIESYQGETMRSIAKQTNIQTREKSRERYSNVYKLRLTGMSFSKIGKEIGVSPTRAYGMLRNYMDRRVNEDREKRCNTCAFSEIHNSFPCGKYNRTWLSCKKLNVKTWASCSCDEYREDTARVICKNCEHAKYVVRGCVIVCDLHGETWFEDTCTDAKGKDHAD